MPRTILIFCIKVFSLTALFTTIMVAIFGISNKHFEPNSHIGKTKTENIRTVVDKIHTKDSLIESEGSKKRLPPSEFQQDLNNLLNNEHRDAYVDSLKTKNRCSLDETTCDKLIRASEYSITQQLRYQTLTIGLINNLDALLTKGNTTKECLDWLKFYKDEVASRGSATHTTIQMNTQPIESYREHWQVLTHELGHIIDLCGLDGVSKKKHNLFTEFGEKVFGIDDASFDFYNISRESERVRKKGSSAKDFISGYASKNPFEDFAESQNAYLNHTSKFRFLANKNNILAKKYSFFESLYGANHFDGEESPNKVKDSNKRVWDTTRWEE